MAKSRKSDPSLFDLPEANEPPPGTSPPPPAGGGTDGVALHEAAQSRYLNYALSVITSRALPDVRDGLKPVQRRILYTMWQQNLTADTKHRKCAKVVGDVMGSYHPHGDAALYETLVRMAQPFSLRYPLIDGSGNFGSLDGDSAAAMRYTECRLARIADEMLSEIDQRTVHFRPNYDGTKTEPVVLPARLPNLLINGTTGIAVGMATNVPPHNLTEVSTALVKLLDNPDLSSVQLCRYVKGPDFPTGGQILNSAEELKEIYKTGSGTIRLRATWEEGPSTRVAQTLYITSIPYSVNKAALVERIADVVLSRKLPPLVDVKDVSTDDVRIALELKKDADARMVMAYLFKHTPLQTNVIVNLTCLIPTENEEVGRPERLDLKAILWHFLHFRLEVVTNRLEHELEALKKRIHILEGFEKVFDALDEIIRIIRKSDGKADSAQKIMKRFDLDAEQTDAILELKLYRLARLEILVIQNELADKRKRARQISGLLKNEEGRWAVVRDEIEEIQKSYGKGDKRRTLIESADEASFTADDFIVEEDNVVLVSRDAWV
jgi:DNA gyrase subunit A